MTIDKDMTNIMEQIDLEKPAPTEEPLRQYYFLKKAKKLVADKAKELHRPLTACTTTFGCQVNTEHEISKAA